MTTAQRSWGGRTAWALLAEGDKDAAWDPPGRLALHLPRASASTEEQARAATTLLNRHATPLHFDTCTRQGAVN